MSKGTRPDLALDPSCWRSGYAVLRPDGNLTEAGTLKAKAADALGCPYAAAMAQAGDLEATLAEFTPANVIIELPSSHVFSRHLGKGRGLSIYGYAVGLYTGVILRAAELGRVGRLIGVAPETWMAGRNKEDSYIEVLATFRGVGDTLAGRDAGHDVSDAIALGLWFQRTGRERLLESRWARELTERFWFIGAPHEKSAARKRCKDAGVVASTG